MDSIGGKWKASTSFRTQQMNLHPTVKQKEHLHAHIVPKWKWKSVQLLNNHIEITHFW